MLQSEPLPTPMSDQRQTADRSSSRRQKRVLFVTRTDGFGGTERHLLELLRRLDRTQAHITILQVEQDIYTGLLQADPTVVVYSAHPGTSSWNWFRLFRRAGPDVVVFVNGSLRAFPCSASVAARAAGVKRIFAIHHLLAPVMERDKGWSPRSIVGRLIGGRTRRLLAFWISSRFADATICVSDAVRRRLVGSYGFPEATTRTIHNGVPMGPASSAAARVRVRTRLGVSDGDFLLVCVARLSEVKGIDILLRTVAQAGAGNLSLKCVIVGDGPLRESLIQQAQELGIEGRIFFEGFQEDVASFLYAAEAFILTSHNEGFPLSILEAMSCALPCVVTDVGGNAEAIRHRIDGFVVPPGSVDELSSAVEFLIQHPNERAKMAVSARARVAEEFCIDDRMADIARLVLE